MDLCTVTLWVISSFLLNTFFVNTLPINDNSNTTINLLGTTPQMDSNSKSIEFNFTLPNHQILKVNISFLMLKKSDPLETRDSEFLLNDENYDDDNYYYYYYHYYSCSIIYYG
ncbi:hypothetical protein CVS40_3163 [Lucilia cuprina]|nr:hypothetical protein CVS40_3163 [Lucilia cuprina]